MSSTRERTLIVGALLGFVPGFCAILYIWGDFANAVNASHGYADRIVFTGNPVQLVQILAGASGYGLLFAITGGLGCATIGLLIARVVVRYKVISRETLSLVLMTVFLCSITSVCSVVFMGIIA